MLKEFEEKIKKISQDNSIGIALREAMRLKGDELFKIHNNGYYNTLIGIVEEFESCTCSKVKMYAVCERQVVGEDNLIYIRCTNCGKESSKIRETAENFNLYSMYKAYCIWTKELIAEKIIRAQIIDTNIGELVLEVDQRDSRISSFRRRRNLRNIERTRSYVGSIRHEWTNQVNNDSSSQESTDFSEPNLPF